MAKTWEQRQYATALKAAKARMGVGWMLLGHDLREALIAREVLAIIGANAREEEPLVKLACLGLRAEEE